MTDTPDLLPGQVRDILTFGHETGRALADGTIVGRAEPYAKVFPSSRHVKRAVGVMAWAILEDIALDAHLDVEGRLIADTNIRRIAANLGVSKNTIAKHLVRLRDHGFVLHEEGRPDATGRYTTSRYVLDPAACVERFTHTPTPTAATGTQPDASRPGDRAAADPTGPDSPHDEAHAGRAHGPAAGPGDDAGTSELEPSDQSESAVQTSFDPCTSPWDTGPTTVSQNAGHRELGHNNKEVVVFKEEQQQHHSPTERHEQLTALGITPATADRLLADHPGDTIDTAIDAADTAKPRNPAGWIIAALRDRWDTTDLATATKTTRAATERRRQADATRQQAGKTAERDRQRADGWLRAVSAALNDDQLAQALRRVTTDVPGVQRRSLPVARTQLLRWAISVHSASDPSQPFTEALRTALPTAQPTHIDDDIERLPEPPDTQQPHQPLDSRFAACFHDMTTTAVGQT